MPDEDPCATLAKLRERKVALATGEIEKRIRFGAEETEYHDADIKTLDRLIAEYESLCAAHLGQPVKRTRYAKGARFTR